DDESRTVIERLLQQRGPGSASAYEVGQAAQGAAASSAPPSGPVFPASSPSDMPAPEDRTVMKPASELLQDALKQAGGAAASLSPEPPPVATAAAAASSDTNVETKRSSGRSEPPAVDDAAAAAAWAEDALKSIADKEAAAPSSKAPAKSAEKIEAPA